MDARIRGHKAPVPEPRTRSEPIASTSARRLRAAEPLLAGVKRPTAKVRPLGAPRHGLLGASARVPEVEDAKSGSVGTPVLGAMQALIGISIALRRATTSAKVLLETSGPTWPKLAHTAVAADRTGPVGGATGATVPYAKAKQSTDPSFPLEERAALPALTT